MTRPVAPRPVCRRLAAGAVLASLAVLGAACSQDDAAPPGGTPVDGSTPSTGGPTSATADDGLPRDIGIDPERYVLDYENAAEYDSARSAPTTVAPSPGGGGSGLPATGPVAPPIGPYDDNTFEAPERNPMVSTADDAQATFGLDVDTGSWTVARAWIEAGTRPDPASIRTEEWVNALDPGHPDPADGAALGAQVALAPSPFVDGHHVLGVAVQAARPAGERLPANIVLVVDTSGSMDIADRLGMVKASLALMAQHLPDGDTLAIVTYADDAEVILEPTPVEDTATIVAAIDALSPGGSTNMEAGLREGYALAAAHRKPGGINRVVLATDGVANNGLTDPAAMAEFVQTQAGDDIGLVTVGYGMGNLNDHLMETLSDRGDGFYAYIDRFEEAERVFAHEINATVQTVAVDARSQVTFHPEGVEAWRQIGYENRALADDAFDDPDVDAGEVGAGHDVTALFELDLVDLDALDASTPLATVALRWQDPATGDEASTEVVVTVGDVRSAVADAPAWWAAATAVSGAAEALADPQAPSSPSLAAAVAALDEAAGRAEGALAATAAAAADVLRAALDLPPAPASTTPGD